jgi:hypothetical protein
VHHRREAVHRRVHRYREAVHRQRHVHREAVGPCRDPCLHLEVPWAGAKLPASTDQTDQEMLHFCPFRQVYVRVEMIE